MKKFFAVIFCCVISLAILLAACSKKAPSGPGPAANTRTPTPFYTPQDTRTATITGTATATPTMTNTPILDIYEPDDSPAEAKPITPDAAAQLHNFYNLNDWDYVTFNGTAGVNYLVRAVNVNGSVMPLSLTEENGAAEYSWSDYQLWAYMPIFCTTNTTYVIRVADQSGNFGLNTDYNLDVITLPAIVPVDFNTAVDNASLSFSFDGSGTWVGQSNYFHTGTSAAQSPHLADAQQAGFSTTVTGPCTVSFWWKVSSESCCDTLSFTADGGAEASEETAGQHDWALITDVIPDAGTHTLRWQYNKDTSNACGYDTAWVDGIEVY